MLIKVRVRAGTKNEKVARKGDTYDISVREKAEGGAANARVLQILARELGAIPKRLRIIKGHRSPSKTIELIAGRALR